MENPKKRGLDVGRYKTVHILLKSENQKAQAILKMSLTK